MTQKTILITGCSSGIGYDAAHGLTAIGWRVFATCRSADDCERLRAEGLESFPLDYSDEPSIKTALAEVLKRTGGTLDALYNNGAFALPGAVEDLPRDGLRAIFETNLFGYFDLIHQVMPVMRAQGHGRIINYSSVLGLLAIRWRGAYCATKFAMEGLTDAMRLELSDSPIHITLIEPGPITSSIRQKAIPQFEKWIDWQGSAHRTRYETQLRVRLYQDGGPDNFELPASAVTAKLIRALTVKRPRPRYYVTTPTHVMGFIKRITSTRFFDWLVGFS